MCCSPGKPGKRERRELAAAEPLIHPLREQHRGTRGALINELAVIKKLLILVLPLTPSRFVSAGGNKQEPPLSLSLTLSFPKPSQALHLHCTFSMKAYGSWARRGGEIHRLCRHVINERCDVCRQSPITRRCVPSVYKTR